MAKLISPLNIFIKRFLSPARWQVELKGAGNQVLYFDNKWQEDWYPVAEVME